MESLKKQKTKASSFIETLSKHQKSIERKQLKILQLNITALCNQVCSHCHVESGPGRSEFMSTKTVNRLLFLLKNSPSIQTVDITGGAPELHPDFRYLILELHKTGMEIIDRCNLTVLLDPGQEDTAKFLADHKVGVVASLPHYTRETVDKQRGAGVFDKSVEALRRLNKLGYGLLGSGLELSLVYNPDGAFLPGNQASLEKDYRERLRQDHNIEFSCLLTLANMPVNRFKSQLKDWESEEDYMKLLKDNFNPEAAEAVMCRELISADREGILYDCDFNQALGLRSPGNKNSIWKIESFDEISDKIAFGDHCHACVAGAGSS